MFKIIFEKFIYLGCKPGGYIGCTPGGNIGCKPGGRIIGQSPKRSCESIGGTQKLASCSGVLMVQLMIFPTTVSAPSTAKFQCTQVSVFFL